MDLRLCVSQTPCDVPYQFKTTGIRVYSFEEALYHVYHYWKQSEDDFICDEFAAWVSESLGLSYLAARVAALRKTQDYHRRMISFLKLADFFDEGELETLQAELIRWEKRRDWEKLKERADYLMGRDEPEKAAVLYKRALQYDENPALYNNLGVACMKTASYEDAHRFMSRALELSPGDIQITMHLIEAAVYNKNFAEADRLLSEVKKKDAKNPDVPFLYGLMSFEAGEYAKSVAFFEEAIASRERPEPHYVYKLAEVYAKMRQYEKSLAALERISEADADFYVKQSELNAAAGNLPAAIKSVKAAIFKRNDSAALWTKLAAYHRMDYDLQTANAAIVRALSLDGENERAKLESARIKKGLGKTREYQSILNSVLRGFKKKYRELNA